MGTAYRYAWDRLTRAQRREAHGWVSDCYGEGKRSDDTVARLVAREYDGGLPAFARDTAGL